MDKIEAGELIEAEITNLRSMTRDDLQRYLTRKGRETKIVVGKSGTKYQVEISAVWDTTVGGDLRVFVAIDDGGWRSFFPMTDSIIVGPGSEGS